MSVLSDYQRETDPDSGRAQSLPLGAYSDPEAFDLEMERVFKRDWFAVCGADDLPHAGDYLAFTVADEPIVVIRSADGELRSFSNVCRHRGMLLYDEGRGNASSVVCPYHAWSYDTCGQLTAAPNTGNAVVDKASHGLAAIGLEVWKGVVSLNLGSNPEPLAPRLAGLYRYLDNFGFERFASVPPILGARWNTNWKLVMENGMDWCHLFRVHPESLNPIVSTRNAFNVEGSPSYSVTASRLSRVTPKRSDDPPSLGAFEREIYYVITISPNIVFFVNAEMFIWLSVLPQSADQAIVCGGGCATQHKGGPSEIEIENEDQLMEEDKAICERMQGAMKSGRGRGGQLVELDRVIKDFHHFLGQRLFDHKLAEPWQDKAELELHAAVDCG